ncbi:hypothetical protein CI610_00634 [invertebrate metagenome]|uniref:RING-type domain-containing protein n=1 Tax=invertebrate metagenome TaxID=1711999 RepID=A0A2H9TAY5_9ZZZZ
MKTSLYTCIITLCWIAFASAFQETHTKQQEISPDSDLTAEQKMQEALTCKICKKRNVIHVLIPCGHFVACDQCAETTKECPIERCIKRKVSGYIKTILEDSAKESFKKHINNTLTYSD